MTGIELENQHRDIFALPFKCARRSSFTGNTPARRSSATGSTPIIPPSSTTNNETSLFNKNITDLMIESSPTHQPKLHSLTIGYNVKNKLSNITNNKKYSLLDKLPKEKQKRYLCYIIMLIFFMSHAVYDVQKNVIPWCMNTLDSILVVQQQSTSETKLFENNAHLTEGRVAMKMSNNSGSSNTFGENSRIMKEAEFPEHKVKDNAYEQRSADNSYSLKDEIDHEDLEVIVLNGGAEGRIVDKEINNVETKGTTNKLEVPTQKQVQQEVSPWYLKTNNQRDLMEFESTKTERKANNNNTLLRSHNKKHNEKDVMIALKNADDGIVNAVMGK